MRRRVESNEAEDATLLAGWMYADLLLGLMVIFLATVGLGVGVMTTVGVGVGSGVGVAVGVGVGVGAGASWNIFT